MDSCSRLLEVRVEFSSKPTVAMRANSTWHLPGLKPALCAKKAPKTR